MPSFPGAVIPEVAEKYPEGSTDCDLAGTGIAARAAVTNARSVAQRIIVPAGFLSDWPTRLPARPARQANKKCGSEIHLDDRIISPLVCIAHFKHDMRHRRTVASYSYTHRDAFRMEAFKDGHICTQSQVVCVCDDRTCQSKRNRKAKSTPWKQMVHGASVQKSTVFALEMRGQS